MLSSIGLVLIQSLEGLYRTKWSTHPQVRKNSFCLTAFKLGHQLFIASGLDPKYQLFLGPEPSGLQSRTTPLVLRAELQRCSSGFQPVCSSYRSWDLSVSIITWANKSPFTHTHTHSHTHTHTQPLMIWFLWRLLFNKYLNMRYIYIYI